MRRTAQVWEDVLPRKVKRLLDDGQVCQHIEDVGGDRDEGELARFARVVELEQQAVETVYQALSRATFSAQRSLFSS